MTKQIIVVGAGLGGLFTAFKLLDKGVMPSTIILIDPRAGRYTRPGHLNLNTFELVTEYFYIKTPHSNALHIKELERIMYNALISENVQFVKESFIRLQSISDHQVKGVITQKDNEENFYPADFVFDCTGREALVANAVNSHHKDVAPVFVSTPLVKINPITDHLVAHVLVTEPDLLISFSQSEITTKSVPIAYRSDSAEKNIETLEQLKALGWPYEAFPTFYSHSQGSKNKVCVYMETPPDLLQEHQSAWIKLLLSIYSNGQVNDYKELKPSKKYGHKPRIMGFKSQPHLLNTCVHQSEELPTVLVGFDALNGFDYRLAHGVNCGITRCNLMFDHITVANDSMESVDKVSIERDIFRYIDIKHKIGIEDLLKGRQQAIENGYRYFSNIYAEAANLLPSESVKKERYVAIAGELAYKAANVHFNALNFSKKPSLKALTKCLKPLIRAFKYFPCVDNSDTYQDICDKLLRVTQQICLEIVALDEDKIVEIDQMNFLIQKIRTNVEQLADTPFANPTILDRCKEINNDLNQKAAILSSPLEEKSTDHEGIPILEEILKPNADIIEKLSISSFNSVSPSTLFAQSDQGKRMLEEINNTVRLSDSDDSPKI